MDARLPADPIATALVRPCQARIVSALAEHGPLSVTDLASACRVAMSTVSYHVTRLVGEEVVRREQVGRCVLIHLSEDPAESVRHLLVSSVEAPWDGLAAERDGRMCHRHLAGRIGVDLRAALLGRRYLSARVDRYVLTVPGSKALRGLGVDLSRPRNDAHPPASDCFDRTERRPHLAGHYARRFATRLFQLGWLERDGREVAITAAGAGALRDRLGVDTGQANDGRGEGRSERQTRYRRAVP